ncbi:AraC-type DNA-binding protein [Dyadobacter soli]|uniref:AraC-type DNA-binding protein n=2 Tax=Dyadobacter soli TaxID=659014 RepID=A0A1G7M0M1_9BACT|nr:AraC-type DNA-binding protein [Dyadobacter soli]
MVLTCNEDFHCTGEKVLEEHALLRIISGQLTVTQAERSIVCGPGQTLLFPKNQLFTLSKRCFDDQPYKSVIISLPAKILRAFYENTSPDIQPQQPEILRIDQEPLLDSLFASMLPYFDLNKPLAEKLVELKTQEAIEILRSIDPDIDGMLSDFSEPGKINRADFMEKNYMFNISLDKFARLTGRSLTTFQRDFKKAFQMSPQRWLTKKRLTLAHYQLAEKRKKPVDVYVETGFENLSHFSYAFKKQFGYSPTMLP